jgi:hypothetical protein
MFNIITYQTLLIAWWHKICNLISYISGFTKQLTFKWSGHTEAPQNILSIQLHDDSVTSNVTTNSDLSINPARCKSLALFQPSGKLYVKDSQLTKCSGFNKIWMMKSSISVSDTFLVTENFLTQ